MPNVKIPNFQSFSDWDLLIFGFLIAVTIAYAVLFVGRGKVVPILVSTYMAFLLVQFAPFLSADLAQKFNLELYELRILAFAAIFLLVLYILSRVIFQSPVGAETFGILPSFLLSLAQTGFLIAIVVSFLPPPITQQFSELVAKVFLGTDLLFYWAAAPVILLLLIGRKANRKVG